MRLDEAFAQFYEEIALGEVPEGKIASAWNRLQNYLVEKLGVSAADVFLQGSYANGTAVASANRSGEYDLDVVAVGAEDGVSADDVLKALEAVLAEDGDYKKRIVPKRPCVRLDYAADEDGRFHVDVVPARPNTVALEIPFRRNGWHETNPAGYTQWCLGQGKRFHRTVRILKRWRDENQDERRGVKSIVLQVLISEHLADGSDAESITGTLENLRGNLEGHSGSPPVVRNPSLERENLADRWPNEHYQAFRREIKEAAELARQALNEPDQAKSHELWQKLLGSDFPGPTIIPRQTPPATPPPGHSARPQQAPKRERYG
jgi:predicted nucleotidyltransferase